VLWYFVFFGVLGGEGFVFFLCLVYPMLPMSLDCSFLIATSIFSNVYLSTFHPLSLSEWWPHHVSFVNYFVLVVKIGEMRLLLDVKQQRINRCRYVRTCIIISNIQNHKTNFYYKKNMRSIIFEARTLDVLTYLIYYQ
jgi:hypothetical protein